MKPMQQDDGLPTTRQPIEPTLELNGLLCPRCNGDPPPFQGESGGCRRCQQSGKVGISLSRTQVLRWLLFGDLPEPEDPTPRVSRG